MSERLGSASERRQADFAIFGTREEREFHPSMLAKANAFGFLLNGNYSREERNYFPFPLIRLSSSDYHHRRRRLLPSRLLEHSRPGKEGGKQISFGVESRAKI
jgi:hypothetical protein